MKKIITTFVLNMFAFVYLMPASAASVPARLNDAAFDTFFDLDAYYELAETAEPAAIKPCRAGTFRVRSRMSTKKKLLHSAVAGGIGAALGGGIGGKRGALIGLGSGAGGYLLYRYVKDRNGRCVPRYVGRG